MPVDTSIYGQVAPPQDPFAIPSKVIGLQQGMLGLNTSQIENQLLQRRLQGDIALQKAYSAPGAVSDTGEPSIPIVRNALVGTPAAVGIPDEVRRAQGVVGGNIGNTGASQALQGAQLGSVGQIFGATLQGGGPAGVKEGRDAIIGALSAGQITPATANTLLAGLPARDANGVKADDRAKAWMNGMFLRTLPNAGAQPTQIGVTAGGAPVTGTTGQAITKATGSVPPPVPTDANGNALNPDGTPTSSNLNPKTGAVTAPGAKAAPAAAAKPAPTMGYQSGLAPGQAESASIDKQGAAQQAVKFETAVNAAPEIRSDIDNAKQKLERIYTGPLAGKAYTLGSGYNQFVDATGNVLPNIGKEKVADYEEFRKLAGSIAARQFSSLGGTGTDSQLNLVQGANPGPGLSKLTNQQMLAMLEGNQDALQTKATAWRQYKNTNGASADFNSFNEDFNNNFSPRAFQFVHLDKQGRQDLWNSMKQSERDKLDDALQTAAQRGWIDLKKAAP